MSLTLNAFLGEALLPAPHHWPTDADPLGNLQNRQALGGQQNDLPPLNMLHRTALYGAATTVALAAGPASPFPAIWTSLDIPQEVR